MSWLGYIEIPLDKRPLVYPDVVNPKARERRAQEAEDREQYLGLAWTKARARHRPESGLPMHRFVERALEDARKDWSKLTRRERMRQNMTVPIDSLLAEPATPGFLPSVMAAAEIASALGRLTDMERFIIHSILAGERRENLAALLGVTPKAVSDIKRRAIAKVRRRSRK